MAIDGITFIIPTYNNSQETLKCVNSIISLGDTKKINYEIILVDDFSDHQNFLHLKEKINLINNEKIIIFKNNRNMGPAFSRNLGVNKARYDYVFFVDSDTEIVQGCIDNFLIKIKNCDAVIGIYNFKPLNSGIFPYYKALLNYFYFYKDHDYPYTTFHAACAGIKKKVFNSLNGFNESIKWGMDYENEEFGYRLTKNNYKIIMSPKTMVSHSFPKAYDTIKIFYSRVSSWVNFFFIKKNFESSGTGRPIVALGTISAFFTLLFFLINFFTHIVIFKYFFLIFILLHLLIFSKFYFFIYKKTKIYLVQLLIIHFFISNVITLGAINGLFKSIKNRLSN